MNSAHLHLILVHIPVLFLPLGAVLLAAAAWRKSVEIRSAALLLFVFSAVICTAAYLFGEGAEEAAEHAAGFVESAVDAHEDAALVSLVLTVLLGVASLVQLFARNMRPALARAMLTPIAALSIFGSAALVYTANQGGRIRHPEAYASGAGVEMGHGQRDAHGRDDDD